MTDTRTKPWAPMLIWATATPFAAYLAFEVCDGFHCGISHALLIGLLAAITWLVPAVVIAVALTAFALSVWRGGFSVRSLQLTWSLLALGAAITGVWFGIREWHDPTYCRIEF